VFKSWAVTKGPSLNPADKRLAVEVEDHPLDYGDFEGTIPKGEYGGGTVMLWDRGFWMPEGTNDINAALRKGELKFTLAGQKLQGSFALVRMKRDRDGGKRNNWLLIKHRDEFASDKDVAKHDKSVASGRTMEQIAAGKGRGPKPFMAAGSKASAPTAIWHSNRARDTKASRASVKLLAATSARKTSARSSGEREATGKAGTTVIMGVAISHPDKALWPAEKKDGPVTKRDLAIYLQTAGAWMIEHLKGRPCSIIRAPDGINAQKFFQRHAMPGVSDLVELTTVEGDRKPTPSKDTWRSLSHLSALRLSRAKGVIDSPAFLPMPSKRASSAARRTPNDSGNSDCRAFRRRQSNAMKIAADCVVGGFRYETGRRQVGSLLLGLYGKDGLLHHVGFTSALADSDKPALTKRLEKLVAPPGFTGDAPGGPSRWSTARSAEWQPLRPELVVEVRYDHVTDNRFRHGTKLVRWRPDKAPAQCTFEQLPGAVRTIGLQ
jgi:DNA ligase D-like protein (predicted 3'-phosphoesterase)